MRPATSPIRWSIVPWKNARGPEGFSDAFEAVRSGRQLIDHYRRREGRDAWELAYLVLLTGLIEPVEARVVACA